MTEFLAVCYLFSPLLIGLIAHGFIIKFGALKFLISPVDRGATFRGRRLFGENKTFRGFTAAAIGTSFGFWLQAAFLHSSPAIQRIELIWYSIPGSIFLGVAIGLAAMVSELPNSFIKRQFDIAPGSPASGLSNIFFYCFDQVDYLIGTWAILAFMVDVTLMRVIYSAIFLFVTHQILSLIGFWLGMRRSAR